MRKYKGLKSVLSSGVFFLILSFVIACSPKKSFHLIESKKLEKRFMSYNIFIGKGMDEVIDLRRAAAVINSVKPDVVGLQEIDSIAERSGWVDQAKALGRMTKMHYVFGPATPRSKGLYGITVLSKEKPLSYHNVALPGQEEPRTFLIVEFKDYIFCNAHWSLVADSRRQSIPVIEEALKGFNKPIFMVGDFNSLPENDDMLKMKEKWQVLSNPSLKTMPSNKPIWTLDYILARKAPGRLYEVLKAQVINDTLTSDHLPIYVDVKF